MKKTFLMLLGLTVVFATAVACFSPSPKADPNSPINIQTNSTPESATSAQ